MGDYVKGGIEFIDVDRGGLGNWKVILGGRKFLVRLKCVVNIKRRKGNWGCKNKW